MTARQRKRRIAARVPNARLTAPDTAHRSDDER